LKTTGLQGIRLKGIRLKMRRRQTGSVIIIVLWTSILLTVLVTAMASKVSLSAKTAVHNQEAARDWLAVRSAMTHAEMELMLERMPRPLDEEMIEDENGRVRERMYRFNGQPLSLNYPIAEDMVVRIYDHNGKINLNRIPRRNMQMLIEKRLGGPEEADPEQVQDLLAAWTDWTDLNDLESLNGAEDEYYQTLEQPYRPRNNPELDTVEELLHIRGFAELFEGVNLDSAFTIYGNGRQINLNLATREAMQLLPGLNDELIELLIAVRQQTDIRNRGELAEIIPFENLQELSSWIGNSTGNIYTIFVYPRVEMAEATASPLLEENEPPELEQMEELIAAGDLEEFQRLLDPVRQAYMEIVEVRAYSNLPRIYKVDPYGRVPDTAPARVPMPDLTFR